YSRQACVIDNANAIASIFCRRACRNHGANLMPLRQQAFGNAVDMQLYSATLGIYSFRYQEDLHCTLRVVLVMARAINSAFTVFARPRVMENCGDQPSSLRALVMSARKCMRSEARTCRCSEVMCRLAPASSPMICTSLSMEHSLPEARLYTSATWLPEAS